ncbi:calcium-binding protein [Allosphingosinicella deserti]|nr:calcium-binding protein [Sphingomonas deserti]
MATIQRSANVSRKLVEVQSGPESMAVATQITGDWRDNILLGTAGDDVIEALGGQDRVEGRAGNDVIRGGAGHDRLYGEAGDDILLGGDDADSLYGGEGNDRLEGGAGDGNWLQGGLGDDVVIGGDGIDLVLIDAGSDTITSGGGKDQVDYVGSLSGDHQVIDTGADDDRVQIDSRGGTTFRIATGAGDDLVRMAHLSGQAEIDLGAGTDLLEIKAGGITPGALITFLNFQPGADGDRIDWIDFLGEALASWDRSTNPFAAGFLRLRQVGPDAVLDIDTDGTGNTQAYQTLFVFKGANAADFQSPNLGGFNADGSEHPAYSKIGTDADEILAGSAGGDTIDGAGGNDTIRGAEGNDLLRGGAGQDTIDGEIGDDVVEGGEGNDSLRGGRGNDIVRGQGGYDFLYADAGADELDGGAGADWILIQAADTLVKIARGGAGEDHISIEAGRGGDFVIDGGSENDRISLSGLRGTADVTLGTGADVLLLDPIAPELLAGDGQIIVRDFQGEVGGDRLEFASLLKAAAPTWDGTNPFGSGYARLVQSGADALLQFDTNGGGDSFRTLVTFQGRSISSFSSASLDGFSPTGEVPAGITLVGTEAADTLRGGLGGDLIEGLGGNDILDGDAGNDQLFGGVGNDQMTGGTGNDQMTGGSGNDIYFVDSLNDVVVELSGGGFDEIRTGVGAATDMTKIYVMPSNVEVFTGSSTTGQGVRLNGGDNFARLGAGNDFVDAATGGNDNINGGGGDDVIQLGNAFTLLDAVNGGAGQDTVSLSGRYELQLEGANLVGIERLVLNGSTDSAAPNAYNLMMSDGNLGTGAKMVVSAETLSAREKLTFHALNESSGSYDIRGGLAGDSISGGGGADLIWGNLGADRIQGGFGRDVFLYRATNESKVESRDIILAFESGDLIDLTVIDADQDTANGDTDFLFIGSEAFSGVAGELRATVWSVDNSSIVVEADTSGDGLADMSILVVVWQSGTQPHLLGAYDFLL